MPYIQRLSYIILFCLACSQAADAKSSASVDKSLLEALNQQIAAFETNGDARFVPLTMKRLLAYQGATMLAFEHHKSSFSTSKNSIEDDKQSQAFKNALKQTKEALADAQGSAHLFKKTYAGLLQLEAEANKAYVYHHHPQMMPAIEVKMHYQQAEQWLSTIIATTEVGKLNQARQSIKKAKIAFQASIDAAMSGLVEQTSRAVSSAASAGGKRYTPHLWSIVSAEFGLLKRYHENQLLPADEKMLIDRPEKPGYAFEMAIYAQKLAIQVKEWRRDKGSHEMLVLKARRERLSVAKTLNIALDYNQVGIDIEKQTLIASIKTLQDTLRTERAAHRAQTTAMNATFEQTLRDDLYKQRIKDQKSFQGKMSSIKSAFRAKLEQETFESKRQSKLRTLFKEDEVEVVSHLNGSLVIRFKNIQFESASSKLDSQYFDLLSRLKEALDLYPERQVTIEGHTDNIGDARANRKLSLERAEAVQEFLIASDIDAERTRSVGYGEAKPIATNMYKQGRAMNRRIDFIIEPKQAAAQEDASHE
ncbi:MAG: OmpA family protein [Ghiorsea sp.]